jgi:hypothetical protein
VKDESGLADLATKIFECVSSYEGKLSNGEVIMAHLVAAHILMTVNQVEFEDQITILRGGVQVLDKQNPVRVFDLDAGDLVEPLTPPSAN